MTLDKKPDPVDELVNRLVRFDPFHKAPLLVLNVDRDLSPRTAHPLSSTPGGEWTVIVYDSKGKYLKAYSNIHRPKKYIAQIENDHPGCQLCCVLTSDYVKKVMFC